ncbi:unnamed protein product [Phytophthora fragariaefolia]|uniref:Unnamed protein product n=1 Tax=Phytophthora fragariaefolia TaxID=1490495 RepID=A0A9W6YFX0_9STRA|nr:unnamed protein product [Phytophthora fragariaefolia]
MEKIEKSSVIKTLIIVTVGFRVLQLLQYQCRNITFNSDDSESCCLFTIFFSISVKITELWKFLVIFVSNTNSSVFVRRLGYTLEAAAWSVKKPLCHKLWGLSSYVPYRRSPRRRLLLRSPSKWPIRVRGSLADGPVTNSSDFIYFKLDITEWISTSWGDLSIETIVSGFAKVGILTDTRVAEAMPTEDAPQIESCNVEELENCNLVDGEVGSDDDIENDSDSDDESNL